MDLCVIPVCCNFMGMLIFFAVFQFLPFQFSYNQRKPYIYIYIYNKFLDQAEHDIACYYV